MFNKRIVVTNHVKARFMLRKIKFTNNSDKYTIYQQIRYDLKPMNIIKIDKISDDERKVFTRQGKVYVVKEPKGESVLIIKTVYKIDLKTMFMRKCS